MAVYTLSKAESYCGCEWRRSRLDAMPPLIRRGQEFWKRGLYDAKRLHSRLFRKLICAADCAHLRCELVLNVVAFPLFVWKSVPSWPAVAHSAFPHLWILQLIISPRASSCHLMLFFPIREKPVSLCQQWASCCASEDSGAQLFSHDNTTCSHGLLSINCGRTSCQIFYCRSFLISAETRKTRKYTEKFYLSLSFRVCLVS